MRISTFNCENLFSRPTVLNFQDNEAAHAPLEELAKLDALIAEPVYDAGIKAEILRLVDHLKAFIDLNELHQKLISTHKVNGKMERYVKADGRGDWVGGIALKRARVPLDAQASTAEVIAKTNADIQCVVEVEDRQTLEEFSGRFFKGAAAYPYNMLVDGNDDRGIDVGLLSRYPLGEIRTHVFDRVGPDRPERIFSRDCLEVEVLLPGGRSLFLLLNHFKSQGFGSKAQNDAKRKRQADRVAEILADYNLDTDLVVVAGDFNDKPVVSGHPNPVLAGLLAMPGLVDVLAKQFPDSRERWTYKDKSQLDYLLVSTPLARAMVAAGVERRGLFEADKLTANLPGGPVRPFKTVTSPQTEASDHGAVWADFNV